MNSILLKKALVTLGIAQFKVKVKTESEKHIYIIPVKYSSQYLNSIVMVIYKYWFYVEYEVVAVNDKSL